MEKQKNYFAFPKTIDMASQLKTCSLEDYILTVTVVRATNLRTDENIAINPFVRMSIPALKSVDREQSQRTSGKRDTINPIWNPPEEFHFVIPDMTLAFIFSVLTRNGSESDSIAFHSLALNTVTELPTYSYLPLTLANGSPSGNSELTVELSLRRFRNFLPQYIQLQTIHEFQRHNLIQWGRPFPTDPGQWSDATRNNFFATMEEAAGPLPEGWEIANQWSNSAAELGNRGWLFAQWTFKDTLWFEEPGARPIRRRAWTRHISPGRQLIEHYLAHPLSQAALPPPPPDLSPVFSESLNVSSLPSPPDQG